MKTAKNDQSPVAAAHSDWGKRDAYVWIIGGIGSFGCLGFVATVFGLIADDAQLPGWLNIVWALCLLPSVPYFFLMPFARKAIFAYCIPLVAQTFVLKYPLVRAAWALFITLVLVAALRSQRNRRAFRLTA